MWHIGGFERHGFSGNNGKQEVGGCGGGGEWMEPLPDEQSEQPGSR